MRNADFEQRLSGCQALLQSTPSPGLDTRRGSETHKGFTTYTPSTWSLKAGSTSPPLAFPALGTGAPPWPESERVRNCVERLLGDTRAEGGRVLQEGGGSTTGTIARKTQAGATASRQACDGALYRLYYTGCARHIWCSVRKKKVVKKKKEKKTLQQPRDRHYSTLRRPRLHRPRRTVVQRAYYREDDSCTTMKSIVKSLTPVLAPGANRDFGGVFGVPGPSPARCNIGARKRETQQQIGRCPLG